MAIAPFHLAIEVRDIGEARVFYGGLLACPEGRSDTSWVDFNPSALFTVYKHPPPQP
jgi:hypothetical protein